MYFLNLYKSSKDTKQGIKSVSIPCFNQTKGIGDALSFVGAIQQNSFYARHGQVLFFDGTEMRVIFEVSNDEIINYVAYQEMPIPEILHKNKGYRYEYWLKARNSYSHIDSLQSCRETQDRNENNARNVNVMQLLGFLVSRMSLPLNESRACSYYKEGYITDTKGTLIYTVTDRAIYFGEKINDDIFIDFADFVFEPVTAKKDKNSKRIIFNAGMKLPNSETYNVII